LPELALNVAEKNQLVEWTRRYKTSQALALRSRIILACAQNVTNGEVAQRCRTTPQTVGKWRSRFVARRLNGLLDEPRSGTPRRTVDAQIERLIATTINELLRDAMHWSTRFLVRKCKLKLSQSTVSLVSNLWTGYRQLKAKWVRRFGLHTLVTPNKLNPEFFVETAKLGRKRACRGSPSAGRRGGRSLRLPDPSRRARVGPLARPLAFPRLSR